jgi:hypothetical protein
VEVNVSFCILRFVLLHLCQVHDLESLCRIEYVCVCVCVCEGDIMIVLP